MLANEKLYFVIENFIFHFIILIITNNYLTFVSISFLGFLNLPMGVLNPNLGRLFRVSLLFHSFLFIYLFWGGVC